MGLGFYGTRFAVFALSPLRGANASGAVIEISKGQGPKELTRMLVAQGIVRPGSEGNFILFGRITRLWKRVKAGEYKFSPEMTPIEAFRVLTSGISILHPLTIREGENIYEIANALQQMGLVSKEQFLKTVSDPKFIASLGFKDSKPKTLEGYLFPDTYFLNKTMTSEDIVRGMYRKFSSVWTNAQEIRAHELGMNRHQIVTLASIVEKETGASDERPMISSVFHNRLKKKMRLQSDPTTIYGIWERYHGNISKADLSSQTPYNTYYVPALPAGPIANPGREALHAALYPSQSDFLYFVSHNDGTHEFTKTYNAHLGAVRKFQLDHKARDGKSWRDLRNKHKSSR